MNRIQEQTAPTSTPLLDLAREIFERRTSGENSLLAIRAMICDDIRDKGTKLRSLSHFVHEYADQLAHDPSGAIDFEQKNLEEVLAEIPAVGAALVAACRRAYATQIAELHAPSQSGEEVAR